MRSLLLKGGRVIDPSRGFDQVADVLIQDGKIAAVGPGLGTTDGAEVRDVRIEDVVPGVEEGHVHMVEASDEYDEVNARCGLPAVSRELCDTYARAQH